MHTHLSGVAFHVHCVGLGCHDVIGVGRLIVRFHHAYAIPSFLLDVAVRLYIVIVNSNCSHNYCLLHIAKTGPLHLMRTLLTATISDSIPCLSKQFPSTFPSFFSLHSRPLSALTFVRSIKDIFRGRFPKTCFLGPLPLAPPRGVSTDQPRAAQGLNIPCQDTSQPCLTKHTTQTRTRTPTSRPPTKLKRPFGSNNAASRVVRPWLHRQG